MKIKYSVKSKIKGLILVVSLTLIMLVTGRQTQSYFTSTPSGIYSNLTEGYVKTTLNQNLLEDNKITNIRVRNDGNVPAYIRVALTVNWKGVNDTVLGETPIENVDYSISLNTDKDYNWFKANGFYYYKKAVQPQEYTEDLISSLTFLKNKDNYSLVVTSITSGIQAMPSDVVTKTWGIEIDKDSNLIKP